MVTVVVALTAVLLVGCVGDGVTDRATSGASARSDGGLGGGAVADGGALDGGALDGAARTPPAEDAPEPVDFSPEFDDGACPADFPSEFESRCGTVDVPSDWSTGDGTVTLAVAVFTSTASDPASDPVVYLEGGPGGHALETLVFSSETLLRPLLERGDVVVFDQRGAGLSEPRLTCPEVTETTRELEDIPIVDDAERDERYFTSLTECRDRLASSVDLADFNSFNNAHDTDAIRRALGYEEWNLFGVSYGTKLGLESMRQHPEGIRSVVLDSVYPPEVDSVAENPETFIESYERVAQACQDEPACAGQGELMARLGRLARGLQADPVEVEISDFVTGQRDEIQLTGDVLVGIVTQALYSPAWFTDLPELATDLEAGGTGAAAQFLSQQRTLERFFSDGMFYAISCREEISFADPATVVDPPDPFGLRETFDLASNTGSNAFESCAAFDNGMAEAEANEQVVSDIPTLLLAGEFDPVTPVSWAERAASGLSRSHLVVAPFESHGVFSAACGMDVIVAFLDDPSVAPDASCLTEGELSFVPSDSVEVEVEDAAYTVDPWGLQISTVRPVGWEVGPLGGDQYRQQSFLDPTQFFQIGGDAVLGFGLAQFLEQQSGVTLSAAEPFAGGATLGSLRADDLGEQWRRRVGTGDGIAVEWFEADVEAAGGAVAYVILVSSPSEQEVLVEQVLIPALRSISVEP